MALDTTVPPSRRAVLTASVGGLVATVAAVLGRPDIARAGSDGDVILGVQTNSTTGVTGITNTVSNAVFYAADSLGVGVEGGGSDKGVYGTSTAGYGVYGHASTGTAVYGESTTGPGVVGTGGTGMSGTSTTGYGVFGSSGGNAGVGGYSNAAGSPAARFWSPANNTGVLGYSGDDPPASPVNTGVFGEAVQDNTSRGVYGRTTVGQGVRGQATSGVGGFFTAGTNGTALKAAGRVTLSRSGVASLPANASTVDVTVPGGLAGTPLPFATLQVFRSGVQVAAVRPNVPSAGVMRIYLNKVASTTAATPISWVVLG